jgi:protein TonB
MKLFFPTILILLCCKLSAQNADSTKLSLSVNTDSVYKKVDVEAQFPGGEKKWNKFVQKTVEKEIDLLVNDEASKGTCIIRFIVDAEGNISAVSAMNMVSSLIAKTMTNEIQKGPKWIPAKLNGINVKSVRELKFTFKF